MPVRNIERELQLLKESCDAGSPETRARELRKALNDKVNVIVAKAATLIGELGMRNCIPDLCSTFERLLIQPRKTDPQCWGKTAIAKALKTLEHDDSAIFRKGAQHVQLEPVWGGEEDTAATLRATCALALLQCTDITREDKFWNIQRLLTEKSPSLRKDGAQALELLGGPEAALLLRLKARMKEDDPIVTGQVFESLLRVEGEGAIPFVVEFLRSQNEEVREEAALSLGASRLGAAVAALKHALTERGVLVKSEVLLRALGISRHEDAIQTLVKVVQSGRQKDALGALEALKIYRDSNDIVTNIREAVASRSESEIEQQFERLFAAAP
ncbi:MAG TPA: HEAT repeat domain-containing protein [Bryobacteraceae bacterium]|jgi:hypothetical protein|nr:HEAT repeat domain-containing protein [Bryobacteraceae bacterium]